MTATISMPPCIPSMANKPPADSGLVIVDKPGGMTSHDVVARVRRLMGTRRVGHAGTLDPMATGVLVVGVEKATRLLGHLMLTEKEYAATIRLGQSTSTDDAEGEPTGGAPAGDLTLAAIQAEIGPLTGEIMQVPPGVSAIKIDGQRAYKLTREGAAPEMKPRPVTVHEFTVTTGRSAIAVPGGRPPGALRARSAVVSRGTPPDPRGTPDRETADPIGRSAQCFDVDAVIRCSSGTYIRALARDLGTALGVGGHLTALRRTRVGPYTLAQAATLDDLAERPVVTPLATAAAAAFDRTDLSADDAGRLSHGMRIPVPDGLDVAPDIPVAAFAPDGALVALVTPDRGRLRALAVFAAS
jgi:tRNA pseudouridine55 synthase